METEELTRLVDGIYKNILDKFNPGARQLINAGKAYLKALHGAAAASRVYVDALSRLALQAQLGTWGGSQDVGSALMRIVEVYKEIQEQEMNILKAFYVDLLVPLETNLEKDTKVVQSEQKRFLQQHKMRSETYSKAAATIKKQRKKSRGASKSGLAMDKELKNMQILEEEKTKLDAFCEQSLKNAMTQERRRYGFVLERQCSLAKHYASFHEVALAALHPSVDEWREVAGTREYLPQSVEDMFASRLRQVSFWPEDEENGGSELTLSSQLRKTRSMDSSCLELRLGPPPANPPSIHGATSHHLALSRARSEANIHASSLSLGPEPPDTPPRPRSMAPASRNSGIGIGGTSSVGGWSDAPLARALFAYLSSGENQLSFLEGDLIALMGDRQKGWQFGENLRTQSSGWFPLAYTEIIIDDSLGSPSRGSNNGRTPEPRVAVPPCKPPPSRPPVTPNTNETTGNNNGSHVVPNSNSSQHVTTPTSRQAKSLRPSGTLPSTLAGGRRVQPPVPPVPPPQAVTSLHSSNDSGFSNEPPVQPDVDYSDDEAMRLRRKPRAERIADADRAQAKDGDSKPGERDWENDSWKTLPKDEKSWQLYKSAMDLWADVNQGGGAEKEARYPLANPRHLDREDPDEARTPKEVGPNRNQNYDPNPRPYGRSSMERRSSERRDYSTDYESQKRMPRERSEGHAQKRPNPNRRSKFTRRDEEEEEDDDDDDEEDHDHEEEEEEEDAEIEEEEDERAQPRYSRRREQDDYHGEKPSPKKYPPKYENRNKNGQYYGDDVDGEEQRKSYPSIPKRDETPYDDEPKIDSDTDDGSTITMPETGRKVEHIAQKLEQTAQKYARGLSPSKFGDNGPRGREYKQEGYKKDNYKQDGYKDNYKQDGYKRENYKEEDYKDEGKEDYRKYEKEEAEKERMLRERYEIEKQRIVAAQRYEKERKTEKQKEKERYFERERREDVEQRSGGTFEKNPDRNRGVERDSSRRYASRPRPPFEDAPERPTSEVAPYRERRYSDKEEIYGETRGGRETGYVDKERGYESNFETKFERSKVLEKHSYQKIDPRSRSPLKFDKNGQKIGEQDANNNNNSRGTLLKNEKKLNNRQNTSYLAGANFVSETKSPKLVKRTKSFWRFRRDSDVLEGMALWQHRSLVDIPKMIKREGDEAGIESRSRKSTPEAVTTTARSPEREPKEQHREIARERDERRRSVERAEEPKPAERSRKPTEKIDGFEEFPTPAERSKVGGDRAASEYRGQRDSDRRSYFLGNISRKAIIEKERKRSLDAKRNMVVAELKENNEVKKIERRKKAYGDDDDGLLQNLSETEASDEESTYSCIVVKDQVVTEKTLLPRTKLRKDTGRDQERDRNTCGPWYDLWGVDPSVKPKK